MTIEEFRADADRVGELRSALANPVLQEALLVVHDGKTILDADETASELASVRKLSNLAGRAEVVRELYLMATLPLEPAKPPIPNFGVDEPPPEGWTPV